MEEAGSKVATRRKKGDRQPGVMHVDLAAFKASADGNKYCLVAAVTTEIDKESKPLPIFVPMPKKDAVCALADRNLHQSTGSRALRIQADGGGEFSNQKLRDLCWEKNIILLFSGTSAIFAWYSLANGWYPQEYGPSNAKASTSSRAVPLESCEMVLWSKVLHLSYSILAGITSIHVQTLATWKQVCPGEPSRMSSAISNGSIMEVECIKVLHMLSNLMLQQRPYRFYCKHDAHTDAHSSTPGQACPSDVQDSEHSECRKEVVHHEETLGQSKSKKKNNKKSNFTIKAKIIPVTPKAVAASTGSTREKWFLSIYKEIKNFLQNMAITNADPALIIKWKSLGKWPLPCQMVFVLKPLTQTPQTADDADQDYKHKSRLVIRGKFAAWGEHSTTTTNLDAPLLRLMLSLARAPNTTWSSIDITSAFLNADTHEDDTVLVTPPLILVKMDIVKPNTVWHIKKATYGLREAPRLRQKERDAKLRELEFR